MSMRKRDVSVVGLYILDVLGRPVTGIPEGGGIDFIDEIRLTVAGTAGGTAVACSKLGLDCAAVGAVGEDEKAEFVLDTMARHGTDTKLMQRVSGVPTSATILNIRPNGERPALHQRGASDHLRIDPAQYEQIFAADVVHLGGTGLLAAMDGAPTAEFLKAAKAHGCTTTFDLIGATAETLELVTPVLPYVDYFIPSIEEAQAMSGRSEVAAVADFFMEQGANTCVFTQGGDGAAVVSRDESFHVVPFAVDVVDTTGCGDAYSAGFIVGLQQGWGLRDCADFANAVAALVATGLGSDAGIVDFDHTVRFMESTPRTG